MGAAWSPYKAQLGLMFRREVLLRCLLRQLSVCAGFILVASAGFQLFYIQVTAL